jgi:hypothetical protein
MKTINILQAFNLHLTAEEAADLGLAVVTKFAPGLQTVADEVAEHWFVKAHTGEVPALDAIAKERADLAAKQAELALGQSALAESMKALQAAQAQLEADRADLVAKQAAATPPAPAPAAAKTAAKA